MPIKLPTAFILLITITYALPLYCMEQNQVELNNQLLDAARSGDIEQVKKLIEAGAQVDAVNSQKTPLLHLITWNNNVEVLQVLIDHGANVHAKDAHGKTPLFKLNLNKPEGIKIAQLLLDNGANINARDMYGNTPLSHVTSFNLLPLVRLFLAHGATVYTKNAQNVTPLHLSLNFIDGDIKFLQLTKKIVPTLILTPRTPPKLTPAERKTIYAILILNKRKYDKDYPLTWLPKDVVIAHILPYVYSKISAIRNPNPIDWHINEVHELLRAKKMVPDTDEEITAYDMILQKSNNISSHYFPDQYKQGYQELLDMLDPNNAGQWDTPIREKYKDRAQFKAASKQEEHKICILS